jgi:hypothetical protein
MGKLFEKLILRPTQRHIEERILTEFSQFGFCAHHSMTVQGMRLMDCITLNFNNNISTAAVFLDIEKAFNRTWHTGLLYKSSELEFSTGFFKLLSSFITNAELKS